MRGRGRQKRRVGYGYREHYFKPAGIPLTELEEVSISKEDLETLRLRYIEKKDQKESAELMELSQSQYQRDLTIVLEKITEALIEGKAIRIEE